MSRLNLAEPDGSHLSTFTYFHPSLDQKSRLDHVYCNFANNWRGYAQPVPYSDHYLVGLFVPKPSDLGPRLWRFPGDLLEDENFCMQIELILSNFDSKCSHASWEEIKAKVQTLSRKNICFHQQQAKLEISALKNSLKIINKRIFVGEKLDSDRISLEK